MRRSAPSAHGAGHNRTALPTQPVRRPSTPVTTAVAASRKAHPIRHPSSLPLVTHHRNQPTTILAITIVTVISTRCLTAISSPSPIPRRHVASPFQHVSIAHAPRPGPNRRWGCRILPLRGGRQCQGRRDQVRECVFPSLPPWVARESRHPLPFRGTPFRQRPRLISIPRRRRHHASASREGGRDAKNEGEGDAGSHAAATQRPRSGQEPTTPPPTPQKEEERKAILAGRA